MNKSEATNIFQTTMREYNSIKRPKYRNANYTDIERYYFALQSIKEHLQGNKVYHDMVNSVSQTYAKLKKQKALTETPRDQIWSNLSERGINKAIRHYPKRKFKKGYRLPVASIKAYEEIEVREASCQND